MPYITTADGTQIYYTDLGEGRPVILSHGWPLSSDAWQVELKLLADNGYRAIAHDRRGHGRSSQPWNGNDMDTSADDLAMLIETLGLRDVVLVGHSTGGGEVARYASRHGLDRIRSVVFAAAVPPYLMKTADNPEGPLDEESFQAMRQKLEEDRDGFLEDFITGFYSVGGFLLATPEQRREALELAHLSDEQAALACMDSWGRTDFRQDLAAVTVPALVIHGEGDATVPLEGSGQRTFAALADADMSVITGAPHGLNVTHRDAFNAALLKFLHR